MMKRLKSDGGSERTVATAVTAAEARRKRKRLREEARRRRRRRREHKEEQEEGHECTSSCPGHHRMPDEDAWYVCVVCCSGLAASIPN